ncbi:unnamed protein product, partial [Strongylus vulgaris]
CFGADRNFAVSNYEGISGSSIAQDALRRKVNNIIKTKIPVLYKELEYLYQLASAVTAQRAIFENSNTADAYHVTITGLAGKEFIAEERQVAMEDIKKAVDEAVTWSRAEFCGTEYAVLSNDSSFFIVSQTTGHFSR